MTRRLAAAACAAAALCVAAGPAQAGGPPARITIVSVFDPITFGERAFVNGQFVGDDDQGGQTVTLQELPFPFTAPWVDVATTTTDYLGYYSFKRVPAASTHYRTVWNGQVVSEKEVQVGVAPRIALSAAAAGRASVRVSGTLAPAHTGQLITIQRRNPSGTWTTIASPQLRGGTKFEGRVRAHKPVVLRAFFAGDGDHLDGFSNAVRALPGRSQPRAGAA